MADLILTDLLKAGKVGLSRTAVRDLLGRHVKGDRIAQACGLLVARGFATEGTEPTEGRPRNVLRVATEALKTTEGPGTEATEATEGLMSPRSLMSQCGDQSPGSCP